MCRSICASCLGDVYKRQVLDGDGCDRSHGGEGQLATRMDAFVEMLRAERGEGV